MENLTFVAIVSGIISAIILYNGFKTFGISEHKVSLAAKMGLAAVWLLICLFFFTFIYESPEDRRKHQIRSQICRGAMDDSVSCAMLWDECAKEHSNDWCKENSAAPIFCTARLEYWTAKGCQMYW